MERLPWQRMGLGGRGRGAAASGTLGMRQGPSLQDPPQKAAKPPVPRPHFHGNKCTGLVSLLYVQLQAQPSGQTPPPPSSKALGWDGAWQCHGWGLARPLGTLGHTSRLAFSSLGLLGLWPRRAGSRPPQGARTGPAGSGASRRWRGLAGAAPAPRRAQGPPCTRRRRCRLAGRPAATSGPAACGRLWSGGGGAQGTVPGDGALPLSSDGHLPELAFEALGTSQLRPCLLRERG